MSVGVMSLVFKAEIKDLPYVKDGEERNAKASTVKLLLLAYADHANDEGEGAYPGYNKLEIKTALSRQGIADTLEAVKQNNLMVFEGVSKLSTNSYRINKELLYELVKPLDLEESSHLTKASQATRRKPSINHPSKPSIKEGATPAPKPAKATTPKEVTLYRTVTKKFPPSPNYDDVITFIQAVSKRLNRDCSADDLRPYYKAWTANGWNQFSINWLDYAVRGVLPTLKKATLVSKAVEKFNQTTDALRRYAEQEGMVIDV